MYTDVFCGTNSSRVCPLYVIVPFFCSPSKFHNYKPCWKETWDWRLICNPQRRIQNKLIQQWETYYGLSFLMSLVVCFCNGFIFHVENSLAAPNSRWNDTVTEECERFRSSLSVLCRASQQVLRVRTSFPSSVGQGVRSFWKKQQNLQNAEHNTITHLSHFIISFYYLNVNKL